jgi:hypothetical protein
VQHFDIICEKNCMIFFYYEFCQRKAHMYVLLNARLGKAHFWTSKPFDVKSGNTTQYYIKHLTNISGIAQITMFITLTARCHWFCTSKKKRKKKEFSVKQQRLIHHALLLLDHCQCDYNPEWLSYQQRSLNYGHVQNNEKTNKNTHHVLVD